MNCYNSSIKSKIAFIAPAISSSMQQVVIKLSYQISGSAESISSTLYNSVTDESGNDVAQDPSVIEEGKYYVIQYNPSAKRFYYLGQQMAHAMVKLVAKEPTEEEKAVQEIEENCKNIKFSVIEDSPFTIEKIGRRNEVLSGGEYEAYKTDSQAMQCAEYELWKRSRLTDTIELETILIPWMDVNQKIEYMPRYTGDHIVREYLIKHIERTLGAGTMHITLSKYYPYYPYIVQK